MAKKSLEWKLGKRGKPIKVEVECAEAEVEDVRGKDGEKEGACVDAADGVEPADMEDKRGESVDGGVDKVDFNHRRESSEMLKEVSELLGVTEDDFLDFIRQRFLDGQAEKARKEAEVKAKKEAKAAEARKKNLKLVKKGE